MRFTVHSNALRGAVQTACRFTSSDSGVPVLTGVLVVGGDGVVTLHATDGTKAISYEVRADVEEGGETVVSGRMLDAFVRGVADAPVTFETDGSHATLTCRRSRLTMGTLDPGSFPDIVFDGGDDGVTIPCSVLHDMVAKVRKSVDPRSVRTLYQCVMMRAEGGMISMSATDTYRMSEAFETVAEDLEFEAVVSASGLYDMLSALDSSADVEVLVGETKAMLRSGGVSLVTRRVVETFPPISALMQPEPTTTIRFDPRELAKAAKRVKMVSSEAPTFLLGYDDGVVTLTASDARRGQMSEAVAAEVEGPEVEVRLRCSYVEEAAEAMGAEGTMSLSGPLQPCVLRSWSETGGFTSVVMPVRP